VISNSTPTFACAVGPAIKEWPGKHLKLSAAGEGKESPQVCPNAKSLSRRATCLHPQAPLFSVQVSWRSMHPPRL